MQSEEERYLTVAQLAELIGGIVEGDATIVLRSVAPLTEAGADELSWLGSVEYLPQLTTTKAGAVLVPQECEIPKGCTVIRVDDPDAALCEALIALAPPRPDVTPGVHASATVSEGAVVEGAAIAAGAYVGERAVIGPGTQLHPGVYVGANSRIGRDCVLWPNVVVREHVTLGDRVVIHPNATIGADGFGYLFRDGRHKKIPQIGTVEIGDDVEIGANSAIDRARSGVTRVGTGTKIDNHVQIGHNTSIGEHCIIVGQVGIAGSCVVGDYCVFAGRAGMSDHLTIGKGVRVATGAIVTKNLPDGVSVGGMPAVAHRQQLREQASLRRLPKLADRIKALESRIKELEMMQ